MPVAELFHIGITVSDLDRSIAFYERVAGFVVTERLHRRSAAFDTLMSNAAPTEVKVAYLSAAGFALQLIEYVAGGDDALALAHNRAGSPHLCFYVADARAAYGRVRDLGDIEITSEITQVAPTMLSFYVRDPDGVPVELLELTEPVVDWTGSVDVPD